MLIDRQADGHTWQPTELVHEAFARLADRDGVVYQNRQHFYAIAAQAMRRSLVVHARARLAMKRRLALLDARQVQVVELRYFAGPNAW